MRIASSEDRCLLVERDGIFRSFEPNCSTRCSGHGGSKSDGRFRERKSSLHMTALKMLSYIAFDLRLLNMPSEFWVPIGYAVQ
jgi:hypothetical protein